MTTVGERVRAEREARKISRTALSATTGIGYSTIAELERGGMQTSTKLRTIAEALGVSLAYLETGKGPKSPEESQNAGLDIEKLTDLLETVDAAVQKSGRQVPSRIKARLIAALYRDEQASAASSAQAVQAALAGLLASME